jgi:hypothetical protein
MKAFIHVILSIVLAFLVFSGCSSDLSDEEAPIDIREIELDVASGRVPKESTFQVDLEMTAIVSDKNMSQDILYEWYVDYVNLDINNAKQPETRIQKTADPELLDQEDLSDDIMAKKSPFDSYYFLDVSSRNPLNAMLSLYQEGYYRITLQASNIIETKEFTIITRVGDPELPTLWLKVNVPELKKVTAKDFRGGFYLRQNNTKKPLRNEQVTFIDATDMQGDWYDTGITINPFNSFHLQAGTHLLDGKINYLCSINDSIAPSGYDSITYNYDGKTNRVSNTSLLIKNPDDNNIISINRSGKQKWKAGNIYISYLTWGLNEKGEDEFVYINEELNSTRPTVTTYLNNKYLAKVFIGSFGHRVPLNKHSVFFGPEGTDTPELDPKREREMHGLPYGYLIGRLGSEGTVFPVGTAFSYTHIHKYQIFGQDKKGNFIMIRDVDKIEEEAEQ